MNNSQWLNDNIFDSLTLIKHLVNELELNNNADLRNENYKLFESGLSAALRQLYLIAYDDGFRNGQFQKTYFDKGNLDETINGEKNESYFS